MVILTFLWLTGSAAWPSTFLLSGAPDPRTLPLIFAEDEALLADSFCPEGCRYDRHAPGESRALYWLGEDAVLFEDFGSGVVTRFWCTMGHGVSQPLTDQMNLVIEVDGQVRFNRPLPQYFDGTLPLFGPPLAYNRLQAAGGNVSFVPIAYGQHCRIRLTKAAEHKIWFQVHYRRPGDPSRVDLSWPPSSDWRRWVTASTGDPWQASGGRWVEETLVLQPGGMVTSTPLSGPNVITALGVKVPPQQRQRVRMSLAFDGVGRGQLSLNVWSGEYLDNHARAFIQADSDGMTLYPPMPFWSQAKTVFDDPDQALSEPITITLRRRLLDLPPLAGSGYFAAQDLKAYPADLNRPLILASAQGSGKWWMNYLTIGNDGPGDLQILEGDEALFRDGAIEPDHRGTGLEDFYGGGFYYRNDSQVPEPFHRELLGMTNYELRNDVHRVSQYRTMVNDAFPFARSMTATMELGPTGQLPANAKNVNFFYLRDHRSALKRTKAEPPANVSSGVSFKDQALAAYLIEHHWLNDAGEAVAIDANGNGSVELIEAAAVTGQLDLSRVPLQSLAGLEAFSALTALHLDGTGLTGAVTIDGLPQLQRLSIAYQGDLTALSLDLPALTHLRLAHCPALTAITWPDPPAGVQATITDLPVLQAVNAPANRLPARWALTATSWLPGPNVYLRSLRIRSANMPPSLNLNRWPALTDLSIKHVTGLKTLTAKEPTELRRLTLNGNSELTRLTVHELPYLRHLSATGHSNLQQVSLQRLPQLSFADLSRNGLIRVEIGEMELLNWLDVSHNRLEQVPDLTAMFRLHGLDLSFNRLSEMPSLPAMLAFLDAGGNQVTSLADHLGQTKLTYADYSENQLTDIAALLQLETFGGHAGHVFDIRGNLLDDGDCDTLKAWRQRFGNGGTLLIEPPGIEAEAISWARWPVIDILGLLRHRNNHLDCPP